MYYQKYKDNWYYRHLNSYNTPEQWEIDYEGEERAKMWMINHLRGIKITRKNWNMQHHGRTNSEIKSKKWLKTICNRKIRRNNIPLIDGNYYRKVNEYWCILS